MDSVQYFYLILISFLHLFWKGMLSWLKSKIAGFTGLRQRWSCLVVKLQKINPFPYIVFLDPIAPSSSANIIIHEASCPSPCLPKMFWAAEIFFLNQKLCPTPGALSGSRGCRFEHYLQHLICLFFSLSPIFCRLVGSFKTFTIFQVGCALLARQRHQVVLSYHLSTPGFWYLYLLTFYICIICIICIVSYVSYVPSINTRYICICPKNF